MEKLKKTFLSANQSVEKCLTSNKGISARDASKLTNGEWKTLTDLAKSWSSVVLPIDHHYYEYMQVHQQIGDRKIVFGK